MHTAIATNIFMSGDSRLLRIDYRPRGGSSKGLFYGEIRATGQLVGPQDDNEGTGEPSGVDFTDPIDIAAHTIHKFPAGEAWTPRRLEINGRKGRRTVCVLAEDRLHYRQFRF